MKEFIKRNRRAALLLSIVMVSGLTPLGRANTYGQELIDTRESVVSDSAFCITQGDMNGTENAADARQLSRNWFGEAAADLSKYDFGALLSEYFEIRCGDFKSEELTYNAGLYSEEVKEEIVKRHNMVRNMQDEYNLTFLDAYNTLYIQSVEYVDNVVNVELKEWIFYDYDDLSDDRVTVDTSGFGTEHSLVLLRTEGEYILVEDAYDEADVTGMTSVFYIAADDSDLVGNEDNIPEGIQAYGNYTYSPDGAAAYADTYWSNYNPAYSDYNSIGGDCANFVSQAIHAGGMPMDEDWFWRSYGDRSSSWAYVPAQRSYFAAKGKLIDNPSSSQILKGNPVWYYNSSSGRYSHAAICVGTNSAGTPIVDAHNNDRYHVHWQLGGSNYWGGFSTVQLDPAAAEPSTETTTQSSVEITTESSTESTTVDSTSDGAMLVGDVNTDGKITADDSALTLQKALDNAFVPPCQEKYPDIYKRVIDVNADGKITADDSAIILQKTLNNAFVFPSER